MRKEYEQPEWKSKWDKFYAAFCRSCRALTDVVLDIINSLFYGSGFMAAKVWALGTWFAETLFALMGNALNPIWAANGFVLGAFSVVVWGLYSWIWVGVTLGAYLSIPTGIAGFLGFIAGAFLNISQVLPQAGLLSVKYADVLGRAGKEAEARSWDVVGVNAQNFLGLSYSKLKFFRNASFMAELTSSAIYQFAVGGFTKTVVIKGVTVIQALPFWPMMSSVAWCGALVVAPEWSIRLAAAAVSVTAQLPRNNYD